MYVNNTLGIFSYFISSGDSKEYTQSTIILFKIENTLRKHAYWNINWKSHLQKLKIFR